MNYTKKNKRKKKTTIGKPIPSRKIQSKEGWEERIHKGSIPGDLQIFKIVKKDGVVIYCDHQVFHSTGKKDEQSFLKSHGIKIAADENLEKQKLEFSKEGLIDKKINKKIQRPKKIQVWKWYLLSKIRKKKKSKI